MQWNIGYKFILKQLTHVIRQNSASGFNLRNLRNLRHNSKYFSFRSTNWRTQKQKNPKRFRHNVRYAVQILS